MSKFERKFLIDIITKTVLTNIDKYLEDKIKDENKRKNIINAMKSKIESIISSGDIVIDNPKFQNKNEFENYILKKSNELRELLLDDVKKELK